MDLTGPSLVSAEAPAPVTPSPRLQSAAHEFEATMLQELLKPLQERSEFSDKDDDEDEDDSGSGDSLREYGTETMARALSAQGGLGISRMVLAKLGPIEAAQEQYKDQHKTGGPGKS